MLDRAGALLKPGGRLVYCTCSLEPEEGEAQIAALLRRNPDIARVPIAARRNRRPRRMRHRRRRRAHAAVPPAQRGSAPGGPRRILRQPPACARRLTPPTRRPRIARFCETALQSLAESSWRGMRRRRHGGLRIDRAHALGRTMAHRPACCALAVDADARRFAVRATCAPSALCARADPSACSSPRRTSAPADPTVADDIYAGYFAFGGTDRGRARAPRRSPSCRRRRTGRRRFMGFGWLRHLRASRDGAGARQRARAGRRISGAARAGRARSGAWRADVAARRMMSWLSQSPLLLEGADSDFYRRFMRSLGRHVAFLQARTARRLARAGAPVRRHRAGAGDAVRGRLTKPAQARRAAGSTRS